MKKKSNANLKLIAIITIASAVIVVGFSLIFTEFKVGVLQNDVVSAERVFVSTDKTAIDAFVASLDPVPEEEIKQQGFGIGVFVDLRDSNDIVIPQTSNLLPVSLQNLVDPSSGLLLDFATIQFDILGLTVIDDYIQVNVDYEVTNNDNIFLSGKAYGSGTTINNELDLKFEQGSVIGDAIEISFENNEVPSIITGTNKLQVRIIHVDVIVGTGFDTVQYPDWDGSFPVYTLQYDSDPNKKTVRNFQGIAVETLPNDSGIQVCGNDFGRLLPGQDIAQNAPTITVQELDGRTVLQSVPPPYGNRDADFNSYKCSSIVTGLDRDHDYNFIVNGVSVPVTTSTSSELFKAQCKASVVSGTTRVQCSSNFGWP